MEKFSEDFKFKDSGLAKSRTLMIKNIPKQTTKEILRKHLSEVYPYCKVTEITMAYEVRDLTQVTEELRDAKDAKEEAERKDMMIYPKACSRFSGLICGCCSEKVR